MITQENLLKLNALADEAKGATPAEEAAIIERERDFLVKMIAAVKAGGFAVPARFARIVKQYNLE